MTAKVTLGILFYTGFVFGLGYLLAWARGKYGNVMNALGALKARAKRAMKALRAKIFGR